MAAWWSQWTSCFLTRHVSFGANRARRGKGRDKERFISCWRSCFISCQTAIKEPRRADKTQKEKSYLPAERRNTITACLESCTKHCGFNKLKDMTCNSHKKKRQKLLSISGGEKRECKPLFHFLSSSDCFVKSHRQQATCSHSGHRWQQQGVKSAYASLSPSFPGSPPPLCTSTSSTRGQEVSWPALQQEILHWSLAQEYNTVPPQSERLKNLRKQSDLSGAEV